MTSDTSVIVPKINTTIGQRNYYFLGSRKYNILPTEIECSSLYMENWHIEYMETRIYGN